MIGDVILTPSLMRSEYNFVTAAFNIFDTAKVLTFYLS